MASSSIRWMANCPLDRIERTLWAAQIVFEQSLFEDVYPLAFHAAENAAREVLSQQGIAPVSEIQCVPNFDEGDALKFGCLAGPVRLESGDLIEAARPCVDVDHPKGDLGEPRPAELL